MRKLISCLLPLLMAVSLPAVTNGDTLASVLAEKGEPTSKLERGNLTILTYPDNVIRVEGGVVVSQKNPSPDYAVRSEKPKPTPRARTASGASTGTAGDWTTNSQSAIGAASGTGRKVFLFFTGSDWCGWCKKLDAEILGTDEFKQYATSSLVLVKLDFPNSIPQSDDLKAQNRQLAQKYHIEGYPTVVVLNDTGAEIGRLGYQRGGPGPFIQKLQSL